MDGKAREGWRAGRRVNQSARIRRIIGTETGSCKTRLCFAGRNKGESRRLRSHFRPYMNNERFLVRRQIPESAPDRCNGGLSATACPSVSVVPAPIQAQKVSVQ